MKRIVAVFGIVCIAVGSVHGQGLALGQGCDPAPSGLVGWWPGNGNGNDTVGGDNATVPAGASFTQAEVGQGFNLNGGANRILAQDAPQLNFGPNQNFSIEAWIRPLSNPGNYTDLSGEVMTVVSKRTSPNTSLALGYEMYLGGGRLCFQMSDAFTNGINYYNLGVEPDLRDGNFHHVVVTLQRNLTNGLHFYIDGQLIVTFDPSSTSGDLSNPSPLRIGNHPDPALLAFYHGIIDEVSIYNRALSAGEILAIYNAGAAGKCTTLVAHVITAQPTNQTVQVGGTATFSVTASGTGPLSYLWSVNGSPMIGANKSTLTLTNVQLSQNGSFYSVQVSDAVGTTNSTAATLTVVTSSAVIAAPPAPPYGSTLSALSGGNPNGPWELFVQDEAVLDTGTNYNGWFLNLTLASPVGAAADDQIFMTSVAMNVPSGSNIVYILSVTNYGPSPSTNVQVSDTLPSDGTLVSSSATQGSVSGTVWNIGTLATNAGAQLTMTVRPNFDGSYVNSAQVSASTPDPNPEDDTAYASVAVGVFTQLQIGDGVVIGDGQFRLTVTGPLLPTVIEASTNLLAWVPVYTNTPPFTFTNIVGSPFPHLFYRAVQGF